jgi:hypothetical protein
MTDQKPKNLLKTPLKVVNVGLDGFARDLARQNRPVVSVQWSPPAGGKPDLARLLSKLGA